MYKAHDSSELAKQVSEVLNLGQQEGLELYKELSQISNGAVKDALDMLSLAVKGASGNEKCKMDLSLYYPERFFEMIRKIEKHQQEKHETSKRYAACIKGTCVRDAQYSKFDDAMPLDDNAWDDAYEMPLFLKVVEAETPSRAKQIAAAYAGVTEDVIELFDI